jgi:dihydrofolate reductase
MAQSTGLDTIAAASRTHRSSGRRLVVVEFMSLDGVVQAPGDPREDDDGFVHGGWTRAFFADHRRYIAAVFRSAGAFVFGRTTFDIFARYWPTVDDPDDDIARALNTRPKYVASTTLREVDWQPTTIMRDPIAALADLTRHPGRDLVVIGSSNLAHRLIEQRLVDEYQLWLHPIVMGSGKRLFPDMATTTPVRLTDLTRTDNGVVILTYQPTISPAGR